MRRRAAPRRAASPPRSPAAGSAGAATHECAGSRSASRSPGRGCSRPRRPRRSTSSRARSGFVVAGLDAELTSRALDVVFRANLGSPVNPGITTTTAGRLPRPARRRAAIRRRASGRTSAAFRPRAAASASRPRCRRLPAGPADRAARSARSPRRPGGHAHGDARLPGRASRSSRPRTRSASTPTRRRRARSPRAVHVEPHGRERPRHRHASAPAPRSAACAPSSSSTSSARRRMSFGSPLLLLPLLAIPLALVGAPPRRAAADALRRPLHERRRARVDRRPRRRGGATSRRACSRSRSPRSASRSRGRTRRGAATSDKAAVILVLDVSGSMQAQDVKPTRLAAARAGDPHLPRQGAEPRQGRARALRGRGGGGDAADDRPRARRARRSTTPATSAASAAPRSATRSRPPCGSASRSKALGSAGHGVAAAAEPRRVPAGRRDVEPARHDPLPLRRPPDARDARSRCDGAALAKSAGFPVYTVALGTTGNTTLRGGGSGFGRRRFFGGGGRRPRPGRARGLAPDPTTLKAIAQATGGAVLPREDGGHARRRPTRSSARASAARGAKTEITDEFVGVAAAAAAARRRRLGALGAAPALSPQARLRASSSS